MDPFSIAMLVYRSVTPVIRGEFSSTATHL